MSRIETEFQKISYCPICDKKDFIEVYNYKAFAGEILGRYTVHLSQCENCGLLISNPRPSKEKINEHYLHNSSGSVFHDSNVSSYSNRVYDLQAEFVKSNIKLASNIRLVDIGCGNGDFLSRMISTKLDLYGLDPIKNKTNENIKFINEYIENYESSFIFDVVTCFNSLEHYFNPSIVLEKISRIIHKDGSLFIEVPDSAKPNIQTSNFYSFEHLTHFTKHTLNELLLKFGFTVISWDKTCDCLRCHAKPNNRNIATSYKKDVQNFEKLLHEYDRKRKDIINNIYKKSISVIEKLNLNIAVYGAGNHTDFLLSEFNLLLNRISYFIDGDKKKWGKTFYGKKIISPKEIKDIDAVLISSHDYEDEIYLKLINLHSEKFTIFTCYKSISSS